MELARPSQARRGNGRSNAMKNLKPPPAAIPRTRLGRLARMGMAAGGLAAGAAAQGLKRMARGEAPDFRGATRRRQSRSAISNQPRARNQLRCTVRAVMPNTSPVSASVRPA